VCFEAGLVGSALPFELAIAVGLLTAVVGFLMIANIPYYSFKTIDLRSRVPFAVMIAMVLVFGLVTVDPPRVLLFAFLAYAASGPLSQFIKWRKRRRA
jgi:CDP-diacylglycerol---serine O-phosphatidyltransferase